MLKSKSKSERIYIKLSILITVFTFVLMILENYIFPKIAIYKMSKPKPDLKFACVQEYKQLYHLKPAKNYLIINNESYDFSKITISSATNLTIKHYFPIDYKKRKLANDIKNNNRSCYMVSYIDVINLGFFRKFYLYQYIED